MIKVVDDIASLTLHERVIQFIQCISSVPVPANYLKSDLITKDDTAYHIVTEIFTTGNCGNFAVALKTAFPEAVMYTSDRFEESDDPGHIITKIGDRFYDITGEVTGIWFPITSMTVDELEASDYIDNYSFGTRGPMI